MKQTFFEIVALFCLSLLLVSIALPPAVADEETGEEQVEDGDIFDEDDEDYEDDEDGDIDGMTVNGQTISFGIPDEDDDFHSMHIAKEFKCDACKILAKQFNGAFDKENEKRPSLKKKLTESTIMDILESECDNEFLSVGVKEVKGVKRLSGPGMSIQDAPGIMQGGGKWPFRMKALCLDIVGEVGEEELYELYLEGKMESHLCIVKYKSCITIMKDGRPRVEL